MAQIIFDINKIPKALRMPEAQCECCNDWVDAEELDSNEYSFCIDCADEICSFCSEGRCTHKCKT